MSEFVAVQIEENALELRKKLRVGYNGSKVKTQLLVSEEVVSEEQTVVKDWEYVRVEKTTDLEVYIHNGQEETRDIYALWPLDEDEETDNYTTLLYKINIEEENGDKLAVSYDGVTKTIHKESKAVFDGLYDVPVLYVFKNMIDSMVVDEPEDDLKQNELAPVGLDTTVPSTSAVPAEVLENNEPNRLPKKKKPISHLRKLELQKIRENIEFSKKLINKMEHGLQALEALFDSNNNRDNDKIARLDVLRKVFKRIESEYIGLASHWDKEKRTTRNKFKSKNELIRDATLRANHYHVQSERILDEIRRLGVNTGALAFCHMARGDIIGQESQQPKSVYTQELLQLQRKYNFNIEKTVTDIADDTWNKLHTIHNPANMIPANEITQLITENGPLTLEKYYEFIKKRQDQQQQQMEEQQQQENDDEEQQQQENDDEEQQQQQIPDQNAQQRNMDLDNDDDGDIEMAD